MSDHSDKPTLEERLRTYMQSEDFALDVSELENEYRQCGKPVLSTHDLFAEALKNQREWLENCMLCEKEGHVLHEDNADAENGTSDLSCERCGFFQRLQW